MDRNEHGMTTRILLGTILAGALVGAGLTLTGCSATRKPNFDLPADDPRTLERAQAATARGDAAQRAGKLDAAIEHYREALTLRADLGQTWNNFGTALQAQQKRAEAAQAFRRAADLLPSDPRPLENLGLLYLETDFYEDALRHYGESLDRRPDWLPSLRGAIKSAKLLNKSDAATQERLRRALMVETDPTWREIFRAERLRVDQDMAERARVQPSDASPK